MIQQVILLSLQILAVHVICQPGMIMGCPRAFLATGLDRMLGMKWSKIVQKPLWDCLACMSGIWTIILTQTFNLPLILAVCGLNYLIQKAITHE